MHKLKINGVEYPIKCTGKTLRIYQEEFNLNLLKSMQELDVVFDDYIETFKLLYSFMKTANENIPDFISMLDSIEDVREILNDENLTEFIKAFNKDTTPSVLPNEKEEKQEKKAKK